jgi:predicted DNA-binding transcriptional regulator AlpA
VLNPNEEKRRERRREASEKSILAGHASSAFDRRAKSPHTPALRFIRLDEVLSMCGKSRSSVYELIKKGEFPAPVKLRGRSSAWINSEIQEWLQACIIAREPE